MGAGAITTRLAGRASAIGGDQYVVGTTDAENVSSVESAAIGVGRRLEFGEIGAAVVGQFSEEARRRLAERNGVRYVERDRRVQLHEQTLGYGIDRIDADVVHGDGVTGEGVDVAVIDSGIDSNRPDLVSNLGEGRAFWPCATPDEATECPERVECGERWEDDWGHGTHCAGIVGAADDDRGVVGVAPDVTLHAVKVFPCDAFAGARFSDIAAGIEYVADRGWDVASMSLGGPFSNLMRDACRYATNRNVVLVASAGNEGCADCVTYPAAYESVIAVSATGSNDELAGFSSRGSEVELAAPGVGIDSTELFGEIEPKSGTSMACPHVSGVVALLVAAGYDHAAVRSRLAETAEDIGLDATEQGNGLVDAAAALGTVDLPTADTTPEGDARFTGSDGDYTVAAAGADVWTTADEYGAVYRADGLPIRKTESVVTTTVTAQDATHPWAKAGLMVSTDITAGGDAPGDVIVAVTPDNGFLVAFDDDGDGYVDTAYRNGSTTYPCELRITASLAENRVALSGACSTDGGATWTELGGSTIAADAVEDGSVDVGAFVSSHVREKKNETTFEGFEIESSESKPDLPTVDTTPSDTAAFTGSDGDYTVAAAGADVWTTADEYGAVYRDVEFTGARQTKVVETTVASQEATHPWAKAGLIVGTGVGSAGVSEDVIVAVTPDNGVVMAWDDDIDGYLDTAEVDGATSYPIDLRATVWLNKDEYYVTGAYSTNGGATWNELVETRVIGGPLDAGVFVSSHVRNRKSEATFEEFTVGSE